VDAVWLLGTATPIARRAETIVNRHLDRPAGSVHTI
jgi:hypothetical protein